METLTFEWNEAKNAANLRKHHVSFEEARTVFSDEYARLIHDPDHSDEEDRFILLGMSANLRVLIVSHTYRDDTIRIISAQKADKSEREQYQDLKHA